MLPVRIFLTLSCHPSLLSITPGRSSRLHPISSQSCCILVQADRPAFACPYEGVHRSMSLMSSSQLLHQCPACLVRLTWIDFVMVVGGRTAAALLDAASRTCSVLLTAFLCIQSSSSSSSCHAISTDIPDPLSSPVSIVHCFR